jgi:hypothetical protein
LLYLLVFFNTNSFNLKFFLEIPIALDQINDNIKEHYLGKMNKECNHCKEKFFKRERKLCCMNGQFKSIT